MRITEEMLKTENIRIELIEIFKQEWPNGAMVTLKNCIRAAELMDYSDIEWIAEVFLSKSAYVKYDKARMLAWIECCKDRESAWTKYNKTTKSIYAKYKKNKKINKETKEVIWTKKLVSEYDKLIAPARTICEKTLTQVWRKYREIAAIVFYKVYNEKV